MSLTNCKKCGRAFGADGNEYCTRCRVDPEEAFKKVKEYLYDHPGASVNEVHEETGVSERLILQFLRDDRIEIRESENTFLDCERCGTSITSGRYCDECAGAIKKGFQKVMTPKEKEEKKKRETVKNNRMFAAERRKK